MLAKKKVVITGMGVLTPIGNNARMFWDRLVKGVSGVRPITRFNPDRFSCKLACEITPELIELGKSRFEHEIKRMDRFIHYALYTARAALSDSMMILDRDSRRSGAVYMGVGLGGLPHIETGVLNQEEKGPKKTSPYLIPSLIPNMAAGMVSLDAEMAGPHYTFGSACAGGIQAIGEAMWAIRTGRIHWALAGGTSGVLTPIAFSGFEAMKALSRRTDPASTPMPFDIHRDGMIVGEGAAAFVLEDYGSACKRNAKIYGMINGYGAASGANGITLCRAKTLGRSMRMALKDAELQPDDIDVIYPRGAGLIACDDQELEAIGTLFGRQARRLRITSTQGHIGYTFAASGPLNLAAALGAIEQQQISPTLKFKESRPGFETLHIVRRTTPQPISHCLINTFGFGGINASLICGAASAGPES